MAHSSQAPLSAVALAGLVMLLFGGSVAAAEGAGALRGTTSGSDAVAEAADVAAVVDNSNSSVLPPLDDLEAFVEEGYTSGGGDSNVTAEGGTSGSSVTAMTVGRGNLSSAIASETAKTLLARSQSSYTLAATIYEHAYWGGAYRGVYGDIYYIGDSWNDQLSSLTIYPNWCLTLYEHISYSGSWRRMCAGSSTWRISYVGDDWNDKVSSIRVSVRR